MMKKREYKFRAECLADVVELIKLFSGETYGIANTYVISNKDWIMGVEVELTIDLKLKELMNIMLEVEDGHTMWHTVTSNKEYSLGEILRDDI